MANRKLRNLRKLGNLRIFFPSFPLLSFFLFWVLDQDRKVEREKIKKISELSEVFKFSTWPVFLSFWIVHAIYVCWQTSANWPILLQLLHFAFKVLHSFMCFEMNGKSHLKHFFWKVLLSRSQFFNMSKR